MENEQNKICPFCGAEKVWNPKTGKWFCKEKCWLNKSNQQKNPQPVQSGKDINWQKVEENNNKKSDSMSELNAKRIAGEYVNIMLELRLITQEQWGKVFQEKANEVYNMRCAN